VVIPYVTMHGSTLALVERLTDGLAAVGVRVERFDLSSVDLGCLAAALVDAATLVVATPTVLTNPHPAMVSALHLIGVLRPKVRYQALLASYGWSTNVVEVVTSLTGALKAETIDTFLVKGAPRAEDLERVDEIAEAIAAKHREAGLE
jgi:flavorubredoxin